MATVLVDPLVLDDFELDLMAAEFRVWPVHEVTTFLDAPRLAFQIRQSLLEFSQGRWDDAAGWTLVWITFGEQWLDADDPDEPIPWPAHAALWDKLGEYAGFVRFNRGLGSAPQLSVPSEP